MRFLTASLVSAVAAVRQGANVAPRSLVQIDSKKIASWEGSHLKIASFGEGKISKDNEEAVNIGEALVNFAVMGKAKQSPLMSQGELNKELEKLSPDCKEDFKHMIQAPEQGYMVTDDMKESMCHINKGKECATKSIVEGDSVDEATGHNVKVTYELEGKGCVPITCYENNNDLKIVARFLRKQAQRMRTQQQSPVKITLEIDCTHLGGSHVASYPGSAAGLSVLTAFVSMLMLW